jgi:hypothetical protein
MADSWNSVQVVTLVVEALTPITVVVLGVLFTRASRRIEQVQWANQTVVTHRLGVFDKLAPGLNQLLCFATFVGGWKETSPTEAIGTKRKLDETMLHWWTEGMAELFSTENAASPEEIQAAYEELSQQFRTDLYVTRQARPLLTTHA